MTRLLILKNSKIQSIEKTMTEVCEAYGLPYWKLKAGPFPRRYYNEENNELWEIKKVPYRLLHTK